MEAVDDEVGKRAEQRAEERVESGGKDPIPALPLALSGARREFDSRAGRISYYVDGPANATDPVNGADPTPMLLIHSINASASAYEVKPMHDHYCATRTVYSVDLPGYGFSERSPREYMPRLMTDGLHAVVEEMQRLHGGARVDALAVSLSCEFLARAAAENPAAYRSVALVSPTGFNKSKGRYGPEGSVIGPEWLYAALSADFWSDGLYQRLTRRGVIRYFLEKTWGSKVIDEGLFEYDVVTTKQPGAKHAPLYFVSARLFSNDINRLYDQLGMPVWMVHGTRGDFVDYRGKALMAARPNWQFTVMEAGALPYFEDMAVFAEHYSAFLQTLPPV